METVAATPAADTDFLPIQGTDYVEFYVGNARQAAHFYQNAFGFQIAGYRGLETGWRDGASYLLVQGKIRFVLTAALHPDSAIADHVKRHGDGVRDIALWVEDARSAYHETVSRGAMPVRLPETIKDQDGEVVLASIATYGDTIHTFVERRNYRGLFLPGFRPWSNPYWNPGPVGLKYVDHCVGNVYLGEMNRYVDFYADVLGFRNLLSFDDKDISTEYSALMSIVMSDGQHNIKFPINEPAEGKGGKSQIQEYIDFYRSAGAQHIALLCRDIRDTVAKLQANGIEFLRVPDTYYEEIPERIGEIDEDIADLKRLGILVDRDDEGYLLQIFTKPVEDRPTVFYEILQRKGCKGFGKGNFKALFVSIEEEQRRRGNL
jgi:4-hydroxyphenylpyruvate dioxygenase